MNDVKYVYRIDDDEELYYSEREVLDFISEAIFDEKDYTLKKSDFDIYRYKLMKPDHKYFAKFDINHMINAIKATVQLEGDSSYLEDLTDVKKAELSDAMLETLITYLNKNVKQPDVAIIEFDSVFTLPDD